MFGAKWRKGPAPAKDPADPAKTDEAAPAVVAAAETAAPAEAIAASAEPAKLDGAAGPEAPAPAPVSATGRASRMVEVTRSRSSRLGRDLKSALARRESWQKPAAAAALALLVGGLGYAAGRQASPDAAETLGRLATVTTDMGESRAETARLSAELKTLRGAVDGIRTERDRAINRQSQLTEKVERSSNEVAGRIGKLAEQLDRMEKAAQPVRTAERPAPAPTPAPVATAAVVPPSSTATPASAAPTPPPKPTAGLDVTQTGSLGEAKPDPRRQVVEAYVLRDVDDGMALVEARNGRFFEVAPGMSLPGLGRVEAIERRGRQWVVLTPKGMVAPER